MWDWLRQTEVRNRDRLNSIVRTLKVGDEARLEAI